MKRVEFVEVSNGVDLMRKLNDVLGQLVSEGVKDDSIKVSYNIADSNQENPYSALVLYSK